MTILYNLSCISGGLSNSYIKCNFSYFIKFIKAMPSTWQKNKLMEEGHFALLCSLPRWQEEEPRYIPKHGNTSARRREKDSPTGHIGWCSDKAWYEDKKLRRGWRGQVESRVEKWAKGNREKAWRWTGYRGREPVTGQSEAPRVRVLYLAAPALAPEERR